MTLTHHHHKQPGEFSHLRAVLLAVTCVVWLPLGSPWLAYHAVRDGGGRPWTAYCAVGAVLVAVALVDVQAGWYAGWTVATVIGLGALVIALRLPRR